MVSKLAQNQTLKIFFSKAVLTIFLVFELKLVLNMTFNLNETYFSEKFAILRYLTSKSSKNCSDWGFWPFSLLDFLDFSHNDSWAWCLVVFLQFAGPVNIFLFTVILWKLLNFLSFWKFLPSVIFYGLILTLHLSPSISWESRSVISRRKKVLRLVLNLGAGSIKNSILPSATVQQLA